MIKHELSWKQIQCDFEYIAKKPIIQQTTKQKPHSLKTNDKKSKKRQKGKRKSIDTEGVLLCGSLAKKERIIDSSERIIFKKEESFLSREEWHNKIIF